MLHRAFIDGGDDSGPMFGRRGLLSRREDYLDVAVSAGRERRALAFVG